MFSFDEKTQCQALDRTQPSLPLRPGRAGTMTHDYKRHGTTDLFAALNLTSGEVITHCRKGRTAVDVLEFFKRIDASVPREVSIHVVLDNLSAHKAPEITKWLAHPRRKRWHLHFTPTSSTWVDLVERWFKELFAKRLRRGVFTSVPDVIAAIETWAAHWNLDPQALRLAQARNRDHREGASWPRHPPPDQISDGPPGRAASACVTQRRRSCSSRCTRPPRTTE